MEDEVIKITVGATVSYRTLSDLPLDVLLREIIKSELTTATVSISYPDWLRCLNEGIFHLDGVNNNPAFEEQREVNLQLRLRPAIAASLPAEGEALVRALLDLSGPCMHTEAWLATEVTQSLPVPGEDNLTTDIGIQTQWAHEWRP